MKRYVTDRISNGEFAPGLKLPSESEIVQALSVSRMTVNRALRELQQEGVITRIQGVGSFVSEPRPKASLLEVRDIQDLIRERGGVHRRRLVFARAEQIFGELAELFDLNNGATVSHVLVAHSDGDTPLQLERRFVRREFAPELLSVDFETVSILDYLQAIAPVSELEHVVEAAHPDRVEAEQLGLAPDAPVLRIRRRTWVGPRVVTLGYFTHPGESYRVIARVKDGQNPPRFVNPPVVGPPANGGIAR